MHTEQETTISTRSDSAQAVPVVLFDGSCPMCSREIAYYRRQAASEKLLWIDISREPDTESRFGVSHSDAMQRFHLRDSAGKWQTGAWAFAELWSHFPGWRILSGILRRGRLLPLTDRVYDRFARWRLKRQCKDGSCTTATERHQP
jgi:predicted DCC family thiol-disulfide oxidoreductase YuxK